MIFTHEPSFLCFLHHSQGSLGFEKTHCTLVGLRGEDVQSDDGSDMGHIGASLSFRICCCRGIAWGACVRVVFWGCRDSTDSECQTSSRANICFYCRFCLMGRGDVKSSSMRPPDARISVLFIPAGSYDN